MNDHSSMNGDGKHRAPNNRISSSLGGQKPGQPENEREQQTIKALTARYDEIEALWNRAEEDLKRFRVPYAVVHCYSSDYETGGPPLHYSLSFRRYGKGWRICYEIAKAYSELNPGAQDEWDCTPIIECPLDRRLAMIPVFKALRKMVVEAAEQAVPTLDEAISDFRNLLKG